MVAYNTAGVFMGQAVMHFNKLKSGSDLSGVGKHNDRSKIIGADGELRERPEGLPADEPFPPAWINIERTKQNIGTKSPDSIGKRWSEVIYKANLKRKPQDNASRGIEAVFTASADSFKTDKEWMSFLKDSMTWADRKFGRENILQWNVHLDETTPHLHIIFAPIVTDPKTGLKKYSSSEFLGGKDGMKKLHTEFFQEVGEKHGVSRGNEDSENKHTDRKAWKSELIKKEKFLEKKESAIKEREEKVENTKNYFIEKENDLKNRELEIEGKALQRAKDFLKIFFDKIAELEGGQSVVNWIKTFAIKQLGEFETKNIKQNKNETKRKTGR